MSRSMAKIEEVDCSYLTWMKNPLMIKKTKPIILEEWHATSTLYFSYTYVLDILHSKRFQSNIGSSILFLALLRTWFYDSPSLLFFLIDRLRHKQVNYFIFHFSPSSLSSISLTLHYFTIVHPSSSTFTPLPLLVSTSPSSPPWKP